MNDSINNLREALEHSPNNVPLRLHLAQTLLDNLLYPDAEKEYREVLRQDPNNAKASLGLADCYLKQKKNSVAIVVLEELKQKDPTNSKALVRLARAYLREDNMGQARETYQELLELDPRFTDDELDQALRSAAPSSGKYDDEDDYFDEDGTKKLEKPAIDFSHVGGMAKVKEEIELKIIHPLQHPDLYKAYGKAAGGGILLYGPPGCGKTHLARATAGQIDARFMSIGISEVLDMWVGNSEKNLHEIFEVARRNRPCVLFFDEVDALGASRTDMRHASSRHLINQFLSEMDGIDASNEGILIVGATNAPWHLDPAFRRPGRFDRLIFVEPPDFDSREAILKILIDGKPQDKVNLRAIAKRTGEFSGADLRAVVDLAIEDKLRQSIRSGVPTPLTTDDLMGGVKKHRATTKEWFNTAKNYALYANDAGLYDDVLDYLKIKK